MTAPARPEPLRLPVFRFGQVWESHRERISTMRYLIVSSDAQQVTEEAVRGGEEGTSQPYR